MLHDDRCRDMNEMIIFEPHTDNSPDARTGLLSLILYYVFATVARHGLKWFYGPLLQIRVILQWFYSLNRQNTFVGGTCALTSAILVITVNGKRMCTGLT